MEISHLVAFNIALLAAMISPGPALLLSVQTSISSGTKAGVFVGFGLASSAIFWTSLAFFGFSVVFTVVPWAYLLFKIVGGAYLIYIACKMIRHADEPLKKSAKPNRNAFLSGVAINLLNPKSVLFASAVLVVIFPINMAISDIVIVIANHFVVEIFVYSLVAIFMNTRTAQQAYLNAKKWLDRIAGMVLGMFGLRLLISR